MPELRQRVTFRWVAAPRSWLSRAWDWIFKRQMCAYCWRRVKMGLLCKRHIHIERYLAVQIEGRTSPDEARNANYPSVRIIHGQDCPQGGPPRSGEPCCEATEPEDYGRTTTPGEPMAAYPPARIHLPVQERSAIVEIDQTLAKLESLVHHGKVLALDYIRYETNGVLTEAARKALEEYDEQVRRLS